jgi:hypothetical protein
MKVICLIGMRLSLICTYELATIYDSQITTERTQGNQDVNIVSSKTQNFYEMSFQKVAELGLALSDVKRPN